MSGTPSPSTSIDDRLGHHDDVGRWPITVDSRSPRRRPPTWASATPSPSRSTSPSAVVILSPRSSAAIAIEKPDVLHCSWLCAGATTVAWSIGCAHAAPPLPCDALTRTSNAAHGRRTGQERGALGRRRPRAGRSRAACSSTSPRTASTPSSSASAPTGRSSASCRSRGRTASPSSTRSRVTCARSPTCCARRRRWSRTQARAISRSSSAPSAPGPRACSTCSSPPVSSGSGRRRSSSLVSILLDVRLDKSEQLTDWSTRPLTDAARSYAAADVVHLLPLAVALRHRLEDLGREAWAATECERLRVLGAQAARTRHRVVEDQGRDRRCAGRRRRSRRPSPRGASGARRSSTCRRASCCPSSRSPRSSAVRRAARDDVLALARRDPHVVRDGEGAGRGGRSRARDGAEPSCGLR